MKSCRCLSFVAIGVTAGVLFCSSKNLLANIPGGGTGTGPDVTLTVNGDGTVTMANGIVSIVITTNNANINQIYYTYNNSGTVVTNQLLAGGTDGGELYWFGMGVIFGTGVFNYSVVANNGDYCEVDLLSASATNGVMDVHYSMLRGSPGFYATPILSHRSVDGAFEIGEMRPNIYAGSQFNWMSVDAARNRLMEVSGGLSIGVLNAPVEVYLWTNGIYAGQYEDKYKYSADHGVQRAWGWSSVGAGGRNVGLWNVIASTELFPGGPMKRDNMCHIGTTILDVFGGEHYGAVVDDFLAGGEVWTKAFGPYFYYCNNLTNNITATNQAAQMLYSDALAQAAAEQTAWPYAWFTNANYSPASNRGAVTGQFVINDSGNPNASAAGLWVGLVQQPSTIDAVYDFQEWAKPYQFWGKTDTNGNFTIPNVITGTNYTLYAFGPGAPDTFMSQNQTGGNPPLLYDLPASPFSVTVTGGTTNNIGAVTWTPSRVGATVFEIGYPDRTARKFRHGDDYWVGDIGPSPSQPSPIWTKFLEYPFDFPNGPNYVVGQSRWTTDWNFIQPIVTDSSGNFGDSTSTITFNLASAPINGAQASLYLGLASAFYAAIIVNVNGNNLGSVSGVTAIPNALSSTGYYPGYNDSDTSIREGINAAFSDERLTFPGTLLNSGANTITLSLRQVGATANAKSAMYDYLRLELTGYVPPPPASVTAYAGNNCNLVCWPATPGATSYDLLRSTSPGSGYVSITNGLVGPICGSGTNNAVYLDTTAVNGTTYFYMVQSVNPVGYSASSPQSSGTTPSVGVSTNAPVAPTGLTVSSVGHQSVTLNWNQSAGANFYSVWRSILVNTGGGSSNTLSTIILNNTNTGMSYTDASPTDGSIYSYFVTATSAAGTSGNSTSAVGVPLPAPPASVPASLTGSFSQSTNIALNWLPVSGAVGYLISRATSVNGPFTFLQSVTETTYTDYGLNPGGTYYYQVTAVNAAGVSSSASGLVNGLQAAPASLSAFGTNAGIILNWPATTGATSYTLMRGTSGGNETTTVVAGYADTTYTNTGLVNGTTYYYVVTATGSGGTSGNSPEASATPSSLLVPGLVWTGSTSSTWDTTTTNWLNGLTAAVYSDRDNVFFNDSSASTNVVITNVVNPGSVTFANSAVNYAMSGAGISGATSLVKTNAGSAILSSTNTYTGGTFVNGGSLVFGAGAAIPANGTLTLNNTGAVTVTTANSLPNVLVNGTNSITGNGNSGTGIATLNDAGTLTLFVSGGGTVFDLTGTITGSGNLILGSSSMTLRFNGTAGGSAAIFNLGTGTAVANVRKAITTAIALGGLTGGSGTQLQGDNSSGGLNMTYTIGGAGANTEFDGAIKDGSVGSVALVKTGSGVLTLTGANTYSAGTTVSNGLLQVNNATGSGTGFGAVTAASGGTLGGSGIISGATIVQSGGTLSPGMNGIGTLTFSNSLTLAAGSTNIFEISTAPATNSVAKIFGALTNGGTLIVTNIGTAALTNGNSFKLFNAASYNGAFANVILPPLPIGLGWKTNGLNNSDTLSVVVVTKPFIASAVLSGNGIAFTGTGGVANANFYLLGSTNLAAPLNNWTRLLTNQFDNGGNFNFSNPFGTNSQNFYLLQLQ